MKYKPYGFSLIELLVTIGILSLLVAIAIPNYLKYKEAPIKAAMKNELTELSKYLQYTVSVDGGYHQKIFTMGYRPSKSLMSKTGFTSISRENSAPLCCDHFSTQDSSGDYSSYFTLTTGADMFDRSNVESATQAHHICKDSDYCEITAKANTTSNASATYSFTTGPTECTTDPSTGFSGKRINCDCNYFRIVSRTKIRSNTEAQMFTSEKGLFCYSDTAGEIVELN